LNGVGHGRAKHHRGTTVEHDAGIDVSLERSSVCVVDGGGKIVVEAEANSEPEALVAWLRAQPFDLARIGLEAGLLSQWLFAGLRDADFAGELLETRHVRDAFKAMPVKTDREDARGIAQLMRLAPPWSPDHGRFADGSRGLLARDGSSRCMTSRWRRRRPAPC
jgi:transposase